MFSPHISETWWTNFAFSLLSPCFTVTSMCPHRHIGRHLQTLVCFMFRDLVSTEYFSKGFSKLWNLLKPVVVVFHWQHVNVFLLLLFFFCIPQVFAHGAGSQRTVLQHLHYWDLSLMWRSIQTLSLRYATLYNLTLLSLQTMNMMHDMMKTAWSPFFPLIFFLLQDMLAQVKEDN